MGNNVAVVENDLVDSITLKHYNYADVWQKSPRETSVINSGESQTLAVLEGGKAMKVEGWYGACYLPLCTIEARSAQYNKRYKVSDIWKSLAQYKKRSDILLAKGESEYYISPDSTCVGYALVVGCQTYERGSLPGIDKDVDKMAQVFRDARFEVTVLMEATKEDISHGVEEMQRKCENWESSCLAFYFSGHGNLHHIEALDGTLKISDIVNSFARIPSLAGKPKLIFLDCCRGSLGASFIRRKGVAEEVGDDEDVEGSSHHTRKYRKKCIGKRSPVANDIFVNECADVLYANATAPDHISVATSAGSLWTIHLARTLRESTRATDNPQSTNVLSILTRVNKSMHDDVSVQAGSFSSQLTKFLFWSRFSSC
jgi:hypothetical protein